MMKEGFNVFRPLNQHFDTHSNPLSHEPQELGQAEFQDRFALLHRLSLNLKIQTEDFNIQEQ